MSLSHQVSEAHGIFNFGKERQHWVSSNTMNNNNDHVKLHKKQKTDIYYCWIRNCGLTGDWIFCKK